MGSAAHPVLLVFPDGRIWVLQDFSPARKGALSEQRVCTRTATSTQPWQAVPGASRRPDKAGSCQLCQGGGGRRQGALQGGMGTSAKERCRLMRCSSSAVPGVWKPEHFQAALVLVTPAKFLCKERSKQRLCSLSSSVSLDCSTDVHALLFQVINDIFNDSRGRVYTDLLGKAASTYVPVSPKQRINLPGVYLLGWPKLRAAQEEPGRRKGRGQPAPGHHCPCHRDWRDGAHHRMSVVEELGMARGTAAERQVLRALEESDPRREKNDVVFPRASAQAVLSNFHPISKSLVHRPL